MVAAGQVGPANRAMEQDVADMGEALASFTKTTCPGAWPGQCSTVNA